LYFFANDGVHGMELWKSNGTEAGTVLVKDIQPGVASPVSFLGVGQMASVGNVFYFPARGNDSHIDLWRTDGTENGTYLVHKLGRSDMPNIGGSGAGSLTNVNGQLYFTADDGTH